MPSVFALAILASACGVQPSSSARPRQHRMAVQPVHQPQQARRPRHRGRGPGRRPHRLPGRPRHRGPAGRRSVNLKRPCDMRAEPLRQSGIPSARNMTSQPDGWHQVRPVERTRSSGTASRVPAMRGPCGKALGRAPHSPRVPRN